MAYQGVAPIFFGAVTDVSTTKAVDIGTERIENGVAYTYVYNDCNSSILTGNGVVLQSGASGMSVTVSSVTSADFLMGVAVNTITTGAYGWVVTRGITNVEMKTTSGSVAAGGLLELGANGEFVPVSNTTGNGPVVGKALGAIVSGASGSAFISVY
jgi:hypothetical protein